MESSEKQADPQITEKEVGELSEKIREAWIGQIGTMFDEKPITERMLWDYCRDLGYTLAWRPTTDGNQTPFQLLADLWFERTDAALVKATRRASKTTILAIWDLLVSKFNHRCWTTHIGVIQAQANRGYRYLVDLLQAEWFKKDIEGQPRVSRTEWKNGSIVEVLTGTARQVSGPSPQKVGVDEADYWDLETCETALQMPTPRGDISTQVCLLSTQYNASGLMSILVPDVLDGRRDFDLYQWNEFDVLQRCPTCLKEQCALYRWTNPFTGEEEMLCNGRGLRATGHISRTEAVKRFRSTGARTWAVQRLGMKPDEGSLAFPMITNNPGRFDVSPIRDGRIEQIFTGFDEHGIALTKWVVPPEWEIQIGNDWGYSHAGCLLVVVRDTYGNFYVVDEIYGSHITPDGWYDGAKRFNREWTQVGGEYAKGTAILEEPIFWCGHDRPGEIYQWNAGGLRAFKRREHRRAEGLATISNMLLDSQGQTQLYIDFDRCPNLQQTLRALAIHKTLKDDLAAGQDDHAYDALRNVLMSWDVGTMLRSRGGIIV